MAAILQQDKSLAVRALMRTADRFLFAGENHGRSYLDDEQFATAVSAADGIPRSHRA